MRGTRYKLQSEKKPTVNDQIKEFKEGDYVSVSLYSGESFPHPNIQGRTGRIIEKRGRSYGVSIKDGNTLKKAYLKPVHLKGLKKS